MTARPSAPVTSSLRIRPRGVAIRNAGGRTLVYTLVITLAILFTLPFLWMVLSSFKTQQQVLTSFNVFPDPWVTSGFTRGWTTLPFPAFIKNTLIYTFSVLGFMIFTNSLTAFGFSRLQWRLRDPLFVVVLATMMVPSQVVLLPQFVFFVRILEWGNTLLPLIVPSAFASAFYVFVLRQFFMTLPLELDEAARIDGASTLAIYWRIIMPLSKPALATVGLFSFINTWNDFFGPLIYLHTFDKMTIAVGLQLFRGQFLTDFPALMAMSTLSLLPIIVVFFFTQKTFIKGIALTGIKQ